jgi:hypothetical protein
MYNLVSDDSSCWEWNYDPENPKYSVTTGYGGGYATVWKLYKLPASKFDNIVLEIVLNLQFNLHLLG